MGRVKLEQIYYDTLSPGGYGGISRLQKISKTNWKETEKWLQTQDAYTLHKPIQKKFTRRRVIVGGINQQLQADLIDVRNLKSSNRGVTFLLTIIDVFSRKATVLPLKNKTSLSMVKAFTHFFKASEPPLQIQSDKGVEFKNRLVQNLFKKNGVAFFVSNNEDIKASIVERFNRTIKERLYRYMTKNNTPRYIHVLADLVQSYNNSYHRSIKRAPSQVTFENQNDVWNILYLEPVSDPKGKLKIGDRVRISKVKKTFEKGYLPNWTRELFTISKVKHRTQPRTYILKDDNDDELEGGFYFQELQKVGEKDVYRISKIIRHRVSKGKKEVLVEWMGYPSSFNSWIPARNIQAYD